MNQIYNEFKLVTTRTFELTDWKDRITLLHPVNDPFDAIHIQSMTYLTDATQLKTLALHISNLNCNKSIIQNIEGTQAQEYTTIMQLDPTTANALVYYENPYQPIYLEKIETTYNQFVYELYVNNLTAYYGIDINNPVFVSISFLKKI